MKKKNTKHRVRFHPTSMQSPELLHFPGSPSAGTSSGIQDPHPSSHSRVRVARGPRGGGGGGSERGEPSSTSGKTRAARPRTRRRRKPYTRVITSSDEDENNKVNPGKCLCIENSSDYIIINHRLEK